MFEKFTQKAIDAVQDALNYADEFNHSKVTSEHLLMGLMAQSKGVQAKILNFDKIDFSKLKTLVHLGAEPSSSRNGKDILFSKEARGILKQAVELTEKLNSKFTMPQHIALAIFLNKNCAAYKTIKQFEIDEEKIISNLKRMLDKSSDIKPVHPEIEVESSNLKNINDFFKEKVISEILSNAQSKLSAKGFEIVGTEQILQSILDNKDYKIVEILNKYSIDSDVFSEKLAQFSSRNAEFENSEKQIIFTPNAFCALMLALDYAQESGSVGIQPEHIVLGILKSKKGIAYHILSSMLPGFLDFEEIVLKKMNDDIPETLAILRLAKAHARALNTPTIGTEIILLGILSYGSGIAYNTLKRLGITLKDAKTEVEKLVVSQKTPDSLSYSPRARKMLDIAYEAAREHKRSKIKSENLLYGITKMPGCLAMKVLSNLGTDVLELQQGIKQELLGGMDL